MPTTTRYSNLDIRVAPDRQLTGVAVPFDTPTDIGGAFETIAPYAFRNSLSGDIRAFVDHDASKLLARVGNGSLELRETGTGLEYTMSLPDTTLGRDTYQQAKEGLLSGVSIGFSMLGSQRVKTARNAYTLTSVDLREVSLITGGVPAYVGTSVAARQRDERWYWKAWLNARKRA